MNLNVARFSLYEYQNQVWTATAESGTGIEDLAKPDYFANIANKLQQYDRICVRVDTGEWYVELLVVACGKNWAKTVVTMQVEFNESVNADEGRDAVFDLYSVVHRGPHCKWSVVRKADKEVIKEYCGTKSEAQAWLSSYLVTL